MGHGEDRQLTGASNTSRSGPPPAKKWLEQYPAPHYSHVLKQLANMCSIYTGDNTSAWGMHKSISCMQWWGSAPVTPTTITSCMFRCDSTLATTISQYEHNITCTCSLLAGRLATNFHRKLIKVDPESLGTTAGSWGYLIEFLETPHQCCVP